MSHTADTHIKTTQEVAARFHELAQEEKWFEIQEELFAEDVTSDEPEGSAYFEPFQHAEGKAAVRRKGENWVSKVEALHNASTGKPITGSNHFAVARSFDITVKDYGRVTIDQIMMYEVRNGQIISERFFY